MPGDGFVAAAVGSETVAAHVGHFRIDDRRLVTCNRQTVERLDAVGARITLGGVLHCDDDRSPVAYTLTLEAIDTQRLTLALDVADPQLNRLYLTFASDRHEHFFGFGEQYASFDLKGRRLPILSSDQGIGRGKQPLTWAVEWQAHAGGAWHTTYTAVPWLLSSRLRALALTDDAYAVFDMRRADDVQITLFDHAPHAVLYVGDSPAALIAAYTADVGRMRPLPAWATAGVIVGMQGGTQAVRHAARG